MKRFLFLTLPVLFLLSCKQEIDSLPEPTQTGANIFGAKINGEYWGPLKAAVLPTRPILEAHFGSDTSVFINARNFSRTPTETEMEIFITGISGPGTYALNKNTAAFPYQSGSYAHYVKRNLNVEDEWITGSAAGGQVTITKFDVANRIVSGTFQFTAAARLGSPPINVTEGRFDVKVQ